MLLMTSVWAWPQVRSSHWPLALKFDFLLEEVTEFREALRLPAHYKMKNLIKDTGEPSDEEIHEARSERFPGAGLLPWVECVIVSISVCVHQSGSSSHPTRGGSFWRLHHVGMINHWLHFLAFLPSLENEGGAETPGFLVTASSFWWSVLEPIKTCLIRTKTRLSPRKELWGQKNKH